MSTDRGGDHEGIRDQNRREIEARRFFAAGGEHQGRKEGQSKQGTAHVSHS
jgi:hypothetical protein